MPALELVRSMVGREIRATVMSVDSGGMVRLRSGGTSIEARATGAALQPGQQLFLKVQQDAPGRYRLVVLEPAAGARPAFSPTALAQFLPPGPLLNAFSNFLRFYNQKVRVTEQSAGAQTGGAGAADAPRVRADEPVVARMLESMRSMAARIPDLDQGALAAVLQGLAAPDSVPENAPDFLFTQGWGETESAEPEPESNADDYVAALGRLADPPFYFLSEIKLAATGRVSVLVLSPDRDFRRISLYLHPERSETADWLEAAFPRLRELAGSGVQWERLEIVRPVADAPESGGSLLDLQG